MLWIHDTTFRTTEHKFPRHRKTLRKKSRVLPQNSQSPNHIQVERHPIVLCALKKYTGNGLSEILNRYMSRIRYKRYSVKIREDTCRGWYQLYFNVDVDLDPLELMRSRLDVDLPPEIAFTLSDCERL